jgi:hypothetical protein
MKSSVSLIVSTGAPRNSATIAVTCAAVMPDTYRRWQDASLPSSLTCDTLMPRPASWRPLTVRSSASRMGPSPSTHAVNIAVVGRTPWGHSVNLAKL